MDLAPSHAAMVVARASHMPRPCAAMEAARSGVSLLSGGICPSPPRRSALAPSTPRVHDPPPPDRDAPPPSCRLARYTQSPAVVSFWFAQSLIGIESPTVRRPRAFYLSISIDFIASSPSTTCIFSEQQGCCCVASLGHSTVVHVYASPLHLHRHHLCVLRNPYCAIRLHKVFVLLIGSLSSSCHYPRRR